MEVVGYVYERLNEHSINKVEREKIAEEIVAECRKRWTILNKYKDYNTILKIKNEREQNNNK